MIIVKGRGDMDTAHRLYKYVVTAPGMAMTWYDNKAPNYNQPVVSFPMCAHGYVSEVIIPKCCSDADLANFLNGNAVDSITELQIAQLKENKWRLAEYMQPTIQQVLGAVFEELKND